MFDTISLEDGVVVLDAVIRFAYNVGLDEFSEAMYGREPNDYTREKFKAMQKSLVGYFGTLDEANRKKLIEVSLERKARKG